MEEIKSRLIATEILNEAKASYAHAKDVYDLIEMHEFLEGNYFIMYCWLARVDPDKKAKEILSVLPKERKFKRVTVGRIANLMNYPARDAIEWCVKTGNCQIKKGRKKMLDYKQAKRLVREIKRKNYE